jgi:hypothetical protein
MPLNLSTLSDLTNNTSTEDSEKVRFSPTGRPLAAAEPAPVSDWEVVARQQQERIEELERLVTQRRVNPDRPGPNNAKPSMTADRLRREWGDLRYLHQSTEAERVQALGVDPKSVDYNLMKDVFGSGANARTANELMLANRFKYQQLREVYEVTIALKNRQ